MGRNETRANLALLLTAIIWGTAFVGQSMAMNYVGPFTFNAARSFVAAVVLVPTFLLLDRLGGPKPVYIHGNQRKSALLPGGIACGLALFLSAGLQQIGMQYTTAGKAGFITALYIVLVPLLGLGLGKRVSAKVWGSVVLAAVGLYLLCINGSLSVNKGDLYILACSFFFAVHILTVDHFSPQVDGVRMSCIQFFVAGCLHLICSLVLESPSLAGLWACIGPILYLGVLSSAVAYTLQILAQKHTDPTVASLLLSLESVFAVLAGWLVLHQTLTLRELVGCAVMFIAILLAQLPSRQKQ